MLLPTKPLRAVFFDWNGTLLNDLILVYGSICHIFQKFGLSPPTLDEYRAEITSNYMEFYWGHGIPRTMDANAMNAIRKQYFEAHWDEVTIHEHVGTLTYRMFQLGMRSGMVSAESGLILPQRLRQFHLNNAFDIVRGDAHNKEATLLECAHALGVSPDESAYVDDTYDGITSALRVGMRAVGVTHGYHTSERIRAAQPDSLFVADTCIEAMNILTRESQREY